MKKLLSMMIAAGLVLSLLAGCSAPAKEEAKKESKPTEPVRVVTMVDTEGGVVGQIMVQMLKNAGYTVDDKTQSANGTDILRKAITGNQADLILDYTGNGMYISGTDKDKEWTDFQKGYEKIKKYDLEKNGLVWLTPAKANNTELLAVTKKFAEENHIVDMNDFAKYINGGGKIVLSSPAYWLNNLGLTGLEKAYGFELSKESIIMSDNRMENMKAVSSGQSNVNCTMIFTTDGVLNELGLYVIKDPLSVPPVYAPTAVASKSFYDKNPDVESILKPAFEALDTETLVALNGKVQSEGLSPADVAKQFLTEKGLLKK